MRQATKPRERARKEMAMKKSTFRKSFVRVEWLALQTVVDLLREAGFDNYYVVQSTMMGDEGEAALLANRGRDLYDLDGTAVSNVKLQPIELGLEGEVDSFYLQPSDNGRLDNRFFLKRTYSFQTLQKGERVGYVDVWVSFAKRTKHDDWEVVHEVVTDQRKKGPDRWVIDRTGGPKAEIFVLLSQVISKKNIRK